jgi:hypothetical protein
METKKVLEHTCFQKEHPLSPVGCRCRKFVSTIQAAKLISEGSAQFVVKSYKDLSIEEPCPVCGDQDKLKNSCSLCGKTGKVLVTKRLPVYGEDIITTVGTKGKRQASTIKKKTPRSPTVESNHILRSVGAIGSGADAAHERIEQYEILTLKERIKLLVVNFNLIAFEEAWRKWEADPQQEFPLELRREDPDDSKKGSGRRYDYGRSV